MPTPHYSFVARCCGGAAALLLIIGGYPLPTRAAESGPGPSDDNGRYKLPLQETNRLSRVVLPWNGRDVVSAQLDGGTKRYVKWWSTTRGGRSLELSLVQLEASVEAQPRLIVETVDHLTQFPDGRWVLPVKDATTPNARWREARSYSWSIEATRPGTYFVEATGQGWSDHGEVVEVTLAGKTRPALMLSHDSRARWSVAGAGRLQIPAAGRIVVTALLGEKRATLNGALRSLTLRPAPAGDRMQQSGTAELLLAPGDASLRGRRLLVDGSGAVTGWDDGATTGFLVWDCSLAQAGTFDVEATYTTDVGFRGCDLEVTATGETAPPPFRLEPTDEREITRRIGTIQRTRPGEFELTLKPRSAPGLNGLHLRNLHLVAR